jgi:hypothetical protein
MTIAEQMNAVLAVLEPWAAENKGHARAAGDVVSVLDMLRAKPGGVLCAVVWEAEDPRGEWGSELGKVDRKFKVVVSRGRGLRLDTGESLTEGSAGGRPMYDLVEEVRELVRGVRLPEDQVEDPDDRKPEYLGTGTYEVGGFVLDAYEVRIGFGTQIPRAMEESQEA